MKTKIVALPKRKQCGQGEINEEAKHKLTVAQCRNILEEEAEALTDEEVIKIRDYLYHLAGAGLEAYQYRLRQAKLVNLEQHKITDNEESHYLRTG